MRKKRRWLLALGMIAISGALAIAIAWSPPGFGGSHLSLRWRFEAPGHPEAVTALSFDPTGETLVSVSREGTLRVWDAVSGGLKGVGAAPSDLRGLRFRGGRLRALTVSGALLDLGLDGRPSGELSSCSKEAEEPLCEPRPDPSPPASAQAPFDSPGRALGRLGWGRSARGRGARPTTSSRCPGAHPWRQPGGEPRRRQPGVGASRSRAARDSRCRSRVDSGAPGSSGGRFLRDVRCRGPDPGSISGRSGRIVAAFLGKAGVSE